jgi:hypothetical protein
MNPEVISANASAVVIILGSFFGFTRWMITKFLSEVTSDFEVLGERNDDWEAFKNNVEYQGFLVRRKKK